MVASCSEANRRTTQRESKKHPISSSNTGSDLPAARAWMALNLESVSACPSSSRHRTRKSSNDTDASVTRAVCESSGRPASANLARGSRARSPAVERRARARFRTTIERSRTYSARRVAAAGERILPSASTARYRTSSSR
jgi:hypothetical protein